MAKTASPPLSGMGLMQAAFTEHLGKCEELHYVDFAAEDPDKAFIIRSGLSPLDLLLDGGLRGGRMTEIYGPNKSGKTEISRSFAEHFLMDYADSQVWYYDQEYALNERTLLKYPIFKEEDSDGRRRFSTFRAENMESFFSVLFKAFKAAIAGGATRIPLLIILDSWPALRPKVEMDQDDFKIIMMAQAKMASEALPKLRGFLARTGAHLLIVNQTRDKPGQMAFEEEESPGGKALKFYADYRLITKTVGRFSFSKGKNVEAGVKPSGFFSRIRIRKNKLGIPDRECEIPITYMDACGDKSGASDMWSVFYTLSNTATGLIKSRGGKFHLGPDSFTRPEWPALYRSSLAETGVVKAETPLGEVLSAWRDRQFAPDAAIAAGDDDDDT